MDQSVRAQVAENRAGVGARKSYRELWTISAGHALTHWYPATFFLLLPVLASEFGLTYSHVGFIVFFDSLTTALANVPTGMLADVVGRRRLLMAIALFAVGLPYLLLGVAYNWWMILICVAFTGIGNNLWHPTAIPALSDLYPGRRGFALSIHGMAANVGDALAPLAVGAALMVIPWRQAVVLNVVPGLLAATLMIGLLRRLSDPVTGGKPRGHLPGVKGLWRGLREMAGNRALMLITASSGIRAMTQKTLSAFLPLYLAQVIGYSPFRVGMGMFALQAAGIVASPVAGLLSDRVGRRSTAVVSMAGSAVVLVIMALIGNSPLFVGFIAVLGFFLFALRPIFQAWVLELAPEGAAGTSIGVQFGVQSLGNAIAPLIGGIIADRWGLNATFWFVAITICLGNLLVLGMPREQQRDAAAIAEPVNQ